MIGGMFEKLWVFLTDDLSLQSSSWFLLTVHCFYSDVGCVHRQDSICCNPE